MAQRAGHHGGAGRLSPPEGERAVASFPVVRWCYVDQRLTRAGLTARDSCTATAWRLRRSLRTSEFRSERALFRRATIRTARAIHLWASALSAPDATAQHRDPPDRRTRA